MAAFEPIVIPNKNFIPSEETILYDMYELFEFDRIYWKDSWLDIYPRLTKWSNTHLIPEMRKVMETFSKDARYFVNRSHINLLNMLSILAPVLRNEIPLKTVISDFIRINQDRVNVFKNANLAIGDIAILKDQLPPLVTQLLAETIVYLERVDEQIKKILKDFELYLVETTPIMAYYSSYHYPRVHDVPVARKMNLFENAENAENRFWANQANDSKHFERERFFRNENTRRMVRNNETRSKSRTKSRSKSLSKSQSKSRSKSRSKSMSRS